MTRTESAFREVNEAIAKTASRFDAQKVDFICKCADPECAHRVNADLEDHEEVRAEATHFLLAPGYHEPEVERIVEFEVVAKVTPVMARIARRLNPRTGNSQLWNRHQPRTRADPGSSVGRAKTRHAPR
jgi:hypothetical protein